MTLSKSTAQYLGVAKHLDTALAQGGGFIRFESKNAATHWRFKAYNYRKLLHKESASGTTPYDSIVLRLELRDGHWGVWVDTTGNDKTEGEFIAPTGAHIEPTKAVDPLVEAIRTHMGLVDKE